MIRSFQPSDTENVVAFHERVLRETGAFAPGLWNDDMKNIEEVYIRSGGCFILLEEENSLLAMGALRIICPTEAEIKRMRVEPSRQRQGLGQQVLDNLLSRAKERGIDRVILDTTEVQRAAQQFYQKNGFVEYKRGRWNDLTLIFYEKRLRRT